MKQTFTLHPSFSEFFSTTVKPADTSRQCGKTNNVSLWVLKNLMAYSAALFVAKTKNFGNYPLILN